MQTSFPPGGALRHSPAERHEIKVVVVLAAILITVFVAGHVPFIPGTLDGIDSTNFVLAIDRYDPIAHQPHPPGFPVHVILGRLVNSAWGALVPPRTQRDSGTVAASLRMWSVISGALAGFALMWMATSLGFSARLAGLLGALAATCPLFWVTAMRPLSDVPGLFFSLLSQALAMAAYSRSGRWSADTSRHEELASRTQFDYWLVAAALVAGLAVGVRVQTALLTFPLLGVVTILRVRQSGPALLAYVLLAVLGGLLAWAVPMVGTVGGPSEYLRLLTTVAASDVLGVDMLATKPSLRLMVLALVRTFITPWGAAALGWPALGLAVLGAFTLAKHNRRALGLVTVMGLPYLMFHLLFQETASIRYALPLVPVSCLLIGASMSRRSRVLVVTVGTVLIAAASVVSVRAATDYGRTGSPVARALEDLRSEATTQSQPGSLAFHHSVGEAVRGDPWQGRVLPTPVHYEWLELVRYWLDGGSERMWFLADGRRTDLALVDPVSRRLVRSYRWPASVEALVGGVQPLAVSWYEIDSPGWFLRRGWALTPETNGVASLDGRSPGTTGITGHIRRRDTAAVMMIGGRNLGGPCDTGAVIELAIDGRPRASWKASPHEAFLQVLALDAGELRGDGEYGTVGVTARDAAGTARIVDVDIEQFDVQSPGAALAGFGRGWHMTELERATGLRWRWTAQTAELRVEGFGRDVELVLRGESALRYFRTAPRVVVRTGETELASFRPDADFEWRVMVPAAALVASHGRVTITSEHSFIPDEVSGNGDRRQLALRIYDVEVRPRSTSAVLEHR